MTDKTKVKNQVRVHPFYLSIGARLHVCPGNLKHPAEAGYKDSLNFAGDIDVRLAAGEATRYCWLHDHDHLCLDVDMHEGGGDGSQAFALLCQDIGIDLEKACGAVLLTPDGGGRHYYWKIDEGLRIKALDKARYAGIDTLGRSIRDNSLTIGAGSTHPTKPGVYRFTTGNPELWPAPDELLALLEDTTPPAQRVNDPRHAGKPGDDFMRTWEGVESLAVAMSELGYVFRLTNDAAGRPYYEYQRPGKTTASRVSGYLGKLSMGGVYQLVSFSHADEFFPQNQSITILEAACRLWNNGEGMDATFDGQSRGASTISRLASMGFGKPSVEQMFGAEAVQSAKAAAEEGGNAAEGIPQGRETGSAQGEFWNYDVVKEGDQRKRVGKTMQELVEPFRQSGLLMSLNGMLFAPRGDGSVRFLKDVSDLFGWLGGMTKPVWSEASGCHGRREFYSQLVESMPQYGAVVDAPHFPRLPGVWYTSSVQPGEESWFWDFVDHFNYASSVDRLLLAASVLTPFWGVVGGRRPVFAITSPEQQGAGKSTFVDAVARLGGYRGEGESRKAKPSKITIASKRDFERIGEKIGSVVGSAATPRLIVIDNYKGACLSASDIESYVTEDQISCWRLYHGDVQIDNVFTWFITGNAMALSEDMAQRSVEVVMRKPEAYSPQWSRTLRNWPLDRVLAGIAAVFARSPIQVDRTTRFDEWSEQVLARVAPTLDVYDALLHRIQQSAVSLSVESEDVQEFESILMAYLESQLNSQDWDGRFSSGQMAAWLNFANVKRPDGKSWSARYVGRMLNTYAPKLNETVTPIKTKSFRGYQVTPALVDKLKQNS